MARCNSASTEAEPSSVYPSHTLAHGSQLDLPELGLTRLVGADSSDRGWHREAVGFLDHEYAYGSGYRILPNGAHWYEGGALALAHLYPNCDEHPGTQPTFAVVDVDLTEGGEALLGEKRRDS